MHMGDSLYSQVLALPSASLGKFLFVSTLALMSTLAQGVSLGLLLPIIQLIQDPTGPIPGGPLWRIVMWFLELFNISYSMIPLSIAVFLAVTIAQMLHYVHQYAAISIAENIGADLRRMAFQNFLNATMRFHHANRSGSLTHSIIQETNRAVVVISSIQEIIHRSFSTGLYITILALISWQTSIVAVLTLGFATLLSNYWIRRSGATGQSISVLHEEVQNFAAERLQGVREVKLAMREKVDGAYLGHVASELATANARLMIRGAQIRAVLEPSLIGTGLIIDGIWAAKWIPEGC